MAMHKLRLEFSVPTDELAETARNLPKQELKELAIAAFYSKGHVTIAEAAQLLGNTQRQFLAILERLQIPYGGDFDPEEADYETQLLQQERHRLN